MKDPAYSGKKHRKSDTSTIINCKSYDKVPYTCVGEVQTWIDVKCLEL